MRRPCSLSRGPGGWSAAGRTDRGATRRLAAAALDAAPDAALDAAARVPSASGAGWGTALGPRGPLPCFAW